MTEWHILANVVLNILASPRADLPQRALMDEIGSNAELVTGAAILVLIVLSGILGHTRRKR